MESVDAVFTPRYSTKHRIMLFLMGPFSLLAIWAAVDAGRERPALYLGAVLIPMLSLVIWLKTFRRISLGQRIVAARYFLPPRVVDYADIKDIGVDVVKLRSGMLSLYQVENADEFFQLLESQGRRGVWDSTHASRDLATTQALNYATMAISMPSAGVLSAVATLIQPFGVRVHWILWFVIFYTPITLVTYRVLKRRSA